MENAAANVDIRELVSWQPAVLHVVTWHDPVVEETGVHPRSLYVETFWLGVLGPSTTWLLRHLVDELEAAPEGVDLALDDVARALGLGGGGGRHSAFQRAIDRCVRYGLARRLGAAELAVRCSIGQVPRRHLLRLPVSVQERHRAWESDRSNAPPNVVVVRRTRLLALDLRLLGVDPPAIERHLQRRGAHPALAYESARWAWSAAEDEAVRRDVQPPP
ncbi:MAG TPA: hypothetical protein VN781_05920 [Acidimicrobiales bacterium]|nr:hypothetical protein [Acidimicrobiales bacterium]